MGKTTPSIKVNNTFSLWQLPCCYPFFTTHKIYTFIIKKIQEDIHKENLEVFSRLVVKNQDDKWKGWRTKMYKVSNPILINKRPN
jgi:hypothetical protein